MTSCRSVFLALLVLAGPAEAAEKYQQVVLPRVQVSDLRKVLVIDYGEWHAGVLRENFKVALRRQIGFDENVPVTAEALRTDFVDFAEARGPRQPSAADVAELAEMAGAEVVLIPFGEVRETGYETWSEKRSRVIVENGETRTIEFNVSCARREAESRVGAVLYDGNDGTVLTEDESLLFSSSSNCGNAVGDRPRVQSVRDMFQEVAYGAAVRFTAQFVPRWDTVILKPRRDASSRDALKLVDAGEWAGVVADGVTALAEDPYNSTTFYHLGLALEVGGRPGDAALLYAYASRIKDDRLYEGARERASRRTEELAKLISLYGLAPRRVEYPQVTPWLAVARRALGVPVAGLPILVKGGRNKRVPVFTESKGGTLASQVPGGTEVRRIEVVAGMVRIQLPDGTEGWIGVKDLPK